MHRYLETWKSLCQKGNSRITLFRYSNRIDEKIRNNKQVNDKFYLLQAQTLYKQFFPYGVQDDLPDGWRIGTVGEIIEIHDSKRIPLSGADRNEDGEEDFILIMVQPLSWILWITTSSTVNIFFLEKMVLLFDDAGLSLFCNMCGTILGK